MIEPLITTIIPTFRRPAQLKRAIRSALNQTYPHLQVCVYDNASGDETVAIVAEMAREDPRVKYHCHEQNINAAPNFEYGMQRVETPYFSFLSDDDVLLPEFYETALAGFRKHPEVAFSAGAVVDLTDKGEFLAISKTTQEIELRMPPQGMFEMIRHYINWTGILFRKEVIQAIGGLDPTVKPIDLDFVLKIAARFPYAVSQKPCAIFIHHPESYSGKNGLKMIWPSWQKIIDNLKTLESLSLLDKTNVELLMNFKMRDWLTYFAKNDFFKKKMDDLVPMADLLIGIPQGVFRGRILKFIAIACKKNAIFRHAFFVFASYSYKLYKRIKNYRVQPRCNSYAKWIEEK